MRDLFHLQTDPPAGGADAPVTPDAEPSATEGVDVDPPAVPANPDSIEAAPPGEEPTPTTPRPDLTPPPPPPAPPLAPDAPSVPAATTPSEVDVDELQTDAHEEGQDTRLAALEAQAADEPSQGAGAVAMPGEPATGPGDAAVSDVPAEVAPQATTEEGAPIGPTGEVAPADQARQSALDSLRETAEVFAQKCQDALDAGVSIPEVLGIASGAIQGVERR